jgi:UDP-N-acetylmuramate--alanine ligase
VSNATAAIAVAHELGMSAENITKGLSAFGGVKRRFTHTGDWNGVSVFDDYAHHPVEIKAVLQAARAAAGDKRVIAVMQPHRYTRLHDLFDDFAACFNDADIALVAPVYEAGEDPIEGANHTGLVSRMKSGGHRDARAISGPADVASIVRAEASEGDYVLYLGAGSITQWAYALPRELAGGEA